MQTNLSQTFGGDYLMVRWRERTDRMRRFSVGDAIAGANALLLRTKKLPC